MTFRFPTLGLPWALPAQGHQPVHSLAEGSKKMVKISEASHKCGLCVFASYQCICNC